MFVIALQGDPARLVAVLALQLAGPHPFVKVESGVQVGFECASHGAKPATVVEYRSTPFRYVWPAELDLMAQLAGLRLRERWDGWTREPFTSESRQHVSIWQMPTS